MKLLGSLTSPYTRKARVVLSEKRIDYEFVLVNVQDPDTQVPDFNPLGKIPVLVLDDGSTIFDSPVIVEYLDGITPVGRLIPEPMRQRILVKRWEALADGILDAAVALLYEGRRAEAMRSPDYIARQRGKISRALQAMAHDLGDKAWCAGDAFNLADVVTGCTLFYLDFRFPEIPWRADHPNLVRLCDKLAKRKSFQDTPPPAA